MSGQQEARQTGSPKERRALVLAALTDPITGDAKPWLAAEEIGYSRFLTGLTLREIVAALQGLRRMGIVEHSDSEWRLTPYGHEKTRTGL